MFTYNMIEENNLVSQCAIIVINMLIITSILFNLVEFALLALNLLDSGKCFTQRVLSTLNCLCQMSEDVLNLCLHVSYHLLGFTFVQLVGSPYADVHLA
jgi:hypothetical protein